jgi:hypothetical protein
MLFLFPLSVWAQETEVVFKGIVTNTEGIGIANVLCKALSATDYLHSSCIANEIVRCFG